MTTAVATMRAVQVAAAGGDLRIIDLKVPDPGPEQVRIKVQACGVCRSDTIIVEAASQVFPIRGFQGMKSPAWWMH
jgi:D-arabinose 1-dehydrogenase-like Zn-dependent alcohol dehydrogenase